MKKLLPVRERELRQISSLENNLFDRVVSILEQARANVVRSVNSKMVIAYWLIGREIVQDLQGGDERAGYGRRLMENLSARLVERFGKGFSVPNLKNFRQFYLVFNDRGPEIGYPPGSLLIKDGKSYPMGSEFANGFHNDLSWSHYRALMRVEKLEAREFYESEAVQCGWNKRQLERQISTLYYERLLISKDKQGMLLETRKEKDVLQPVDVLKDPYILEFLDLPDVDRLHETDYHIEVKNFF